MSSGLVKGAVRSGDHLHPSIGRLGGGMPVPSAAAPASPDLALQEAAARERQRRQEDEARAKAQAAELEALRRRAVEEGLEQGRQQGRAEAQAAVADALQRLATLQGTLQAAFTADQAGAQALLSELSFIAVNRLLGDALHDPRAAVAAVEATLSACDAWQSLTIEVHPEDVQYLDAARERLPNAALRDVRVVASTAVALGGCRVSGMAGNLDARWETQLAALKARLDEARAAWPAP